MISDEGVQMLGEAQITWATVVAVVSTSRSVINLSHFDSRADAKEATKDDTEDDTHVSASRLHEHESGWVRSLQWPLSG